MKRLTILSIVLLTILGASRLSAQDRFPQITEDEVSKTLKFIASDALRGRDTPSPGLEQTAAYLRDRFQKAGLKPGAGDGFYHTYKRNGQRVSLSKVELKIMAQQGETVLKQGEDFRIFSAPLKGYKTESPIEPARMKLADAARKGLWNGRRIPKLLLVETPKESPLWDACAGDFLAMRRRMPKAESAPIILVKPGIMPKGKFKASVQVPESEKSEIALKNVVALLPGTDKKDEYVLVSAHYDHVGVGIPRKKGGDGINNGADDNGTGTTAVIELAEMFAALPAQQRPRRSILFVCFSGEEKGLLGSKAMAENPPVPLSQIAVNVNIEMIGRPAKGKTKCAWVTGVKHSDFEEIAKVGFKRAGVKIIGFKMSDMLYNASDNAPFARKGVVAHSISAGSLHKDYHRPTDEFEKINLKHMTAIINGLAEVVREFGNREERPKRN